MGHRVTILAASFSHLRSLQPITRQRLSTEIVDGIRYVWIKTPSYCGNGVGRIVNILVFFLSLFRFCLRPNAEDSYDVVIASSTYPLDNLPAYLVARKYKAKLIYEVHDLWPLSPIELGGMSPWHPFIVVMQFAENFAYRHVSAVVSLLPNAGMHMREHGLQEGKFHHLPNGVDCDEWMVSDAPLPEEHERLLRLLRQRESFLVGYAGAHGVANALEQLIDAADLLKAENISFVLLGDGPEKAALMKKTQTLKLPNVFFLPRISRNAAILFLRSMDTLFVGLQNRALFRFGISPNKLMDYMMAAKPIVQAVEAGNDLVSEAQCGISVPAENPGAIAEAIRTLHGMPKGILREMGDRGRRFVVKYHDYRVIAAKFISLLSQQ